MGVENIEDKVLRCNPFLEAFGNAKTNRNDNSSRFGKFLRLEFYNGRIIGASMKHYLLEKSRIVEPGPGERSYHIFYFLLRGASAEQKLSMKLEDISYYNYLNQSGCDTVENMNDVEEFHDVVDALNTVGVSDEEINDVWRALSAVMRLGNVILDGDINDEDSEASISDESIDTMNTVNSMLKADVGTWFCRRSVGGGRASVVIKTMNVLKSTDARDALAKAIYNKIFDWLVKKVNESLYVGDSARSDNFIGLLDIFGFEIFEENSFEQLCINFCNEKLQMLFNEHVFTLEAEIYKQEGINVSAIQFRDNKDCVLLIEQKPYGLLPIMDDVYRRGARGGSDLDLLKKFDAEHSGKREQKHTGPSSFYRIPKIRNSRRGTENAFYVKHFAGEVMYKVPGFLEKNRDALHGDLEMALQDSDSDFIAVIFGGKPSSQRQNSSAATMVRSKKSDKRRNTKLPDSIAYKFKNQLRSLNMELLKTEPSYIRCVKTNSIKAVHYFEPNICLRQLIFAGVLECVRIRREGFPFRKTFEDFWRMCQLQSIDKCLPTVLPEETPIKLKCKHVLDTALPHSPTEDLGKQLWQLGKTKLFMRDAVYEALIWWYVNLVCESC
jgi:myosin-5